MARYPMTPFTPGGLLLGGGGTDPFLALHREMNRLFDDLVRGGGTVPSAGGPGQGGGTPLLLAPQMDVSETDDEVRIQAELPGVSEQDIEVSLDEDVLTIRAEKRQERHEERRGVHISERAYGTFQRSLRLPFRIDPDQVQARFENGVLGVTLPKTRPQQERSRRIQVQGGGGVGGQQGGAGGGGSRQQPQIEGEAAADEQQGGQAGGEGSGTRRQRGGSASTAGSASGGKARRAGRPG
jgi:HSP20 family protein